MIEPALPRVPMKDPWHLRLWRQMVRVERWVIRWFTEHEPTFGHALLPLLLLSVLLFIRHPATNYIFDEQEALLANPYVNGIDGLTFGDVIYRDFWGLPPTGSIGSYRPIPNLVWRGTWWVSKHPFFHHLYNLLFHALNGAMLASFAYAVTKRRMVGWLSAVVFVCCAVLTEAVSGIVGIADVLGGLGAIGALCALRLSGALMPLGVFIAVSFGLFCKESALVCVPLVPAAALLTAPLLHSQRPLRWLRALLAALAAAAAFILYVELRKQWFPSPLPAELTEALPADASDAKMLYHELLKWFHQAALPKDPLNNPLAEADFSHRVAGALRVYWRGLTQVLLPLRLSGDYSFPQEPIPTSLYEWETVAGGLMTVFPLVAGLLLMVLSWFREWRDKKRLLPVGNLTSEVGRLFGSGTVGHPYRDVLGTPLIEGRRRRFTRRKIEWGIVVVVAGLAALVTEVNMLLSGGPHWVRTWPVGVMLLLTGAGLLIDGWQGQRRPMEALGVWPWRHVAPPITALALVWVVVSYFPHSNIPVVLPTVRAERFWYFPAVGSALGLGVLLAWLVDRWRAPKLWGTPVAALLVGAFISVQGVQAYRHSMDYRDDLHFWRATKLAAPDSAKAHLNYSVMVGARGDLETRLRESEIAKSLAPKWPMAHIYTGDTLCRMHRAREAWPHYAAGFSIGPNERSLIALALQCMYDETVLLEFDEQLRKIAEDEPGSWVAYLATDTLDNHEEHKGVDPQYRPRGYNEGPKK